MRIKQIFILGLIIIFLSSCASDPYKYKDSRMVFKINVEEPDIKKEKQLFYLIDKKVTVFPFIDNRNFEKVFFATDIPCSLLFAKTLYKKLNKNFVFNKLEFADEKFYINKNIFFDKTEFLKLKNKLKTDGIMWGIIYEFDIIVSSDKIPQQYILTLHARGDIKIMTDDGTITYYNDYNKSRSYTFKSESFFSYSIYDIRSSGSLINDFLEWIMDGEINHLIAKSNDFIKGNLSIENFMPDVLTYPQENTKLYDASMITTASFQKSFINILGGIGGTAAGFAAAYYLSSSNSNSGLYGLLIGAPIGLLSGLKIANYFSDKVYEENERKATFYAYNKNYDFTFYIPIFILKL